MPTFHIVTFGCQANEADSERIAGALVAAGYGAAPSAEEADVILLNTCSIREKAEQKVYSLLGRYQALKRERPGMKIALTGCLGQLEGAELQRRFPGLETEVVVVEGNMDVLTAHQFGITNAVASLGVKPKEITWQAGVDVLCFGGTKNGIAVGEAVVFFDRELAREFDYRCKQGGQLASKMRFLSAPWTGMLKDGAWLRHAKHANAMAKRLEAGIRGLPQIEIAYPVQSNVVFARIPEPLVQGLYERGWKFYTHVGAADEARLMCSWDTTPGDVDAFVADLKAVIEGTIPARGQG